MLVSSGNHCAVSDYKRTFAAREGFSASFARADALKSQRITRQNLPCTFELDV